jgi:CheY-like chemotaxis protein
MSRNPAPFRFAERHGTDFRKPWTWAAAAQTSPATAQHFDLANALVAHPNAALRVLVVDDCPVNLALVSAKLQALGVVPMQAADGAEAVALACEWQFDLILMDLQMPILDGRAATSAIRRFERHGARPEVPVVAHSSNPQESTVLARHGLSGHLPKPCTGEQLEQCLGQWCPSYCPSAAIGAGPHRIHAAVAPKGWLQAAFRWLQGYGRPSALRPRFDSLGRAGPAGARLL